MGFLDKMNNPVFLKNDSNIVKLISKLKELQAKASREVKERIDREIKLALIGEIGENNIAFELKNSGMPMYVMHDVYFEKDGLSAQIDYIVVTRKVTFIIECKNLIGNIEIDNAGNFIRNYKLNGKNIKEGIYSPITQNQRHLEVIKRIGKDSKSNIFSKMLFEKYFDENYKSIVVLANPKTILNAKYAKKEIKQMVIRADQLNNFIKNVNKQSKQLALNDKEMKKFAERLLKFHTPNLSDYANKYEDITNNLKDQIGKKDEEEKDFDKTEIIDRKSEGSTNELIKKLKTLRLEISRGENIKPYFVFNDKQMVNLISKMPSSKEELQEVSGFGKIKAEKYGDIILKILHENRESQS